MKCKLFLQKITSFNPARKHTIIPKAKSYKKAKSICTNFSILFRKYNTSSPTTKLHYFPYAR